MSQTYWKSMLASARESIWVHLKNDMRPDRLRDERSQGETNKTQENAIIRIRIGREYKQRGEVKKKGEKERKGQFARNFFGSKSRPNVLGNEWSNGESAERFFAMMATWMGEIISCKVQFSHHFPGIPAVASSSASRMQFWCSIYSKHKNTPTDGSTVAQKGQNPAAFTYLWSIKSHVIWWLALMGNLVKSLVVFLFNRFHIKWGNCQNRMMSSC